MLLVLISLMTATVITAAYLASRDNSSIIGDNISDASTARWGASTGLTLATAMLETEVDWRSRHQDGDLLQNFSFADVTLKLSIEDLETGAAPGENSTYLRIHSAATAAELEHGASALLMVPVPKLAGIDLADFALFATGEMRLRNGARVKRWDEAPLSVLSLPIALATLSTSSNSIRLESTTMAVDTTAWLPPGSTVYTLSNASPLRVNAVFMEDSIPFPDEPDPVYVGSTWTPAGITAISGGTFTIDSNVQFDRLDVVGSATANFVQGTVVIDDDLRLETDVRLTVTGDATLVIHGNLQMLEGASIELAGNGRLRIFVGGDLSVEGFIGEFGGRTSGPALDGLGHADVGRIHLMSMAGDSSLDWRLDANALLKCHVYAPHADIRLSGRTVVCGTIAAATIDMRNDSVVYYDHALDRRVGYTNPVSPVYDADGRIKQAFAELASLNDDDLLALADSESVRIRALGGSHGTATVLAPVVSEGESTPRPVRLMLSEVHYDDGLNSWEQ